MSHLDFRLDEAKDKVLNYIHEKGYVGGISQLDHFPSFVTTQ